MKNLICLFLLVVSGVMGAQTIQRGLVKEYNDKAQKPPLAGATVRVNSAQSTVSDKDGTFSLEFLTTKPGERVSVRAIEKNGYVIFNKEAVEQWNLNPKVPFVIVMCRSEKFKQLKDLYYRNSEERYNAQYKNAVAEVKRLKEQKKLQEKEYSDRLREIEDNYNRQLKNLDNYVDRFARIDLSEISAAEQEIIELVQNGMIDEAISKYEELNIVDKLISVINQRKEVHTAITQLSEIEESVSQSNDSLYAMAERQIQTLMIAGGSENNKKIQDFYVKIADADTTNVIWLLKTGLFISNYVADYNLALHYYQIALNSALAQYGEEHPDVATSYNNIGMVFYTIGKYDKALNYLKKSLAIREKIYGVFHPAVATSYNNIGMVYSDLGEYKRGLDFFAKALTIRKKIYGEEHPDIATSYNNIGMVFLDMENNDKALDYLKKSLAIREKIYGEEHPDVATSYNNIGGVFSNLGENAKALDYYTKALTIREKIYGEEHPAVATSYNNIGMVFLDMENNDKALEYYTKALSIRKKIYGEFHPNVAASLQNIGTAYNYKGDFQAAIRCAEEEIYVRKNMSHQDDEKLSFAYMRAGDAYNKSNNKEKAMENFKKALELRLQLFGENEYWVKELKETIGNYVN